MLFQFLLAASPASLPATKRGSLLDNLGGSDPRRRRRWAASMPLKVGFYKRGCQEKTPLPPQERKQVSDIPLPPSGCNTIHGLARNFSLHVAGRSRRHSGTYKQRGRFWATMVLSETRGLSLHWVVRGGIRSLGRLKA